MSRSDSAAESLVGLVLNRLRQDGEVETDISPSFLVRNWPPAVPEWNTKSVRDYFFASPRFPRLLVSDAIKTTISRGIQDGHFACCGKSGAGTYEPFLYKTTVPERDVEISDGVVLIPKAEAEAYRDRARRPAGAGAGTEGQGGGVTASGSGSGAAALALPSAARGFRWVGAIPAQKWMNFYTKVLTRFAVGSSMSLRVTVEVRPTTGVSPQQLEETRSALRELGSGDQVEVE